MLEVPFEHFVACGAAEYRKSCGVILNFAVGQPICGNFGDDFPLRRLSISDNSTHAAAAMIGLGYPLIPAGLDKGSSSSLSYQRPQHAIAPPGRGLGLCLHCWYEYDKTITLIHFKVLNNNQIFDLN